MANRLTGKEVAAAITQDLVTRCEDLNEKGITPTLAIVRVSENPSDLAYERGATNRAAKIGVDLVKIVLDDNVTTEDVVSEIEKLNEDNSIDGILIFRPLPKYIDDDVVRNAIAKEKDVDGIGDEAMAGVYSGKELGYPPCTAAACIEILKHYGIQMKGKRAVVVGRSLVIGRPVAMMLMQENATVTICHTKTENMAEIVKEADIVIAAAGRANTVSKDFGREGQTVIDVGINVDEDGNMTGDADFEGLFDIVENITPVPGGVGGVTTSILMKHVIEAAEKSSVN